MASRSRHRRLVPLTGDEECGLIRRFQETGDRAARDAVVAAHGRRIRWIAVRMANYYRVEVDDLAQEAFCGLCRAIEKFDCARGVSFTTYSEWWIQTFMQVWIFHNAFVAKIDKCRETERLFSNLTREKIRRGIYGRLCSDAEAEDIGATLKCPPERVRAFDAIFSSGALPIDEVRAFIADKAPSPEEQCITRDERAQRRNVLRTALLAISPRNRRIFARYYAEKRGDTTHAMAREYGVSHQRVEQIARETFIKVMRRARALASEQGMPPPHPEYRAIAPPTRRPQKSKTKAD